MTIAKKPYSPEEQKNFIIRDGAEYTKNRQLLEWVADMAMLCEPNQIYWCDGSEQEYQRLCDKMVEHGTFTRLNPQKRPQQLPRPFPPQRCRPRRGAHLHLHTPPRRCRPHQ